jgi:hypothetical protein
MVPIGNVVLKQLYIFSIYFDSDGVPTVWSAPQAVFEPQFLPVGIVCMWSLVNVADQWQVFLLITF